MPKRKPRPKKKDSRVETQANSKQRQQNAEYGTRQNSTEIQVDPASHHDAVRNTNANQGSNQRRQSLQTILLFVLGHWSVIRDVLTLLITATGVIAAILVLIVYAFQLDTMTGQLKELSKQGQLAQQQLILSQRPWIKIKHRIVKPLTFNVGGRASGIPVAMMIIEDTIENVGQNVAINVFSWEDIIPIDPDHSTRTARARLQEWCDANRHKNTTDPAALSGYTLFPRDPVITESIVGPQMPTVMAATIQNEAGLNGKAGFVLVGCVVYRCTFEPPDAPSHQTRFMYYLGAPIAEGGFQPYVVPVGIAADLRLITMPDGFHAD